MNEPKLLMEAQRALEAAVQAEIEGVPPCVDLFLRQAAYLESAAQVVPVIQQDRFYTRCLLGMVPAYPTTFIRA